MKKMGLMLLCVLLAGAVQGQKLIPGERAPEIKIGEWIGEQPAYQNKATLIEFFYSPSKPSQDRLPVLEMLATRYGADLNVILLAREPREKIAPLVGDKHSYGVGLDDNGKTFGNYNVQFIPYSVLLDRSGLLIWNGNSSQLTNQIVESAFQSPRKR